MMKADLSTLRRFLVLSSIHLVKPSEGSPKKETCHENNFSTRCYYAKHHWSRFARCRSRVHRCNGQKSAPAVQRSRGYYPLGHHRDDNVHSGRDRTSRGDRSMVTSTFDHRIHSRWFDPAHHIGCLCWMETSLHSDRSTGTHCHCHFGWTQNGERDNTFSFITCISCN